jgi:hypothetical protein
MGMGLLLGALCLRALKRQNIKVVGYGLDYNEHLRTLPYVGVLSPAGIARYAEKK